jgi:hypothetical protein
VALRLVVDISAHGFGHLAQIAPVLREFHRRAPSPDIVVRTRLPRSKVQEFLALPCRFAPASADIVPSMHGPHLVDTERSTAAYRRLHEEFRSVAASEARALEALDGDLLLSDVDYTGLAGAALLGMPAVALCSFHWAEAVSSYLAAEAGMGQVVDDILQAYNSAQAFLLAAPRRTTSGLDNARRIGPLARDWGQDRSALFRRQLGLPQPARIGTVMFGGMSYGYPALRIPQQPGWFWLVPDNWSGEPARADTFRLGALGAERFIDVLASSDLVLTKTGYGTFMECASHRVPCLFLARPDWPESAEIERWMSASGHGRPLGPEQMAADDWLAANRDLLATAPPPFHPTGHRDAVDYLLSLSP